MAKIHLLVELDVKPDQVSAFTEMFITEFISRSRAEEGCEFYQLWQDPDSSEKMAIIETWSSQAHLAQAWFADFAPKMEAMQATPLVVRKLASVED